MVSGWMSEGVIGLWERLVGVGFKGIRVMNKEGFLKLWIWEVGGGGD